LSPRHITKLIEDFQKWQEQRPSEPVSSRRSCKTTKVEPKPEKCALKETGRAGSFTSAATALKWTALLEELSTDEIVLRSSVCVVEHGVGLGS